MQENRGQVFHILNGEAAHLRGTPFGSIGELFSGSAIQAVWVCKHNEAVEPNGSEQPHGGPGSGPRGQLHFEFEDPLAERTIAAGDLLVFRRPTRRAAGHTIGRVRVKRNHFHDMISANCRSRGECCFSRLMQNENDSKE